MHYRDWNNIAPISVDMSRNNGYGYGGIYNNIASLPFFDEYDNPVRFNNSGDVLDAYIKCPPLASVLNNCADAFCAGEFWALNSNTENDVRGKNKAWQSILEEPNSAQTSGMFFRQLYIYRKLYGWCYVYKQRSVGLGNKPTSMFVIPPWMIRIEPVISNNAKAAFASGSKIRKIFLCFKGYDIELLDSDIIMFSDNSVLMDENTLMPLSRFTSEEANINTIIAALDARQGLIRKKGALGIFSTAGTGSDQYALTALSDKEKERIQQEYNKYGLNSQQHKVIFTEAALRWQSTAFNVTELGITPAIIEGIKGICDAANYPFILTAFSDQSTYNNVTTADRRLYQNNIISDAAAIMKTLAKGLNAGIDNVMFVADYTKIPALQQTAKEKGEGELYINRAHSITWKNNTTTRNQWLEALNMNKLPADKGGDLLYDEYIKEYGQEQSEQGQTGGSQASQTGNNQEQ